MGKTSSGASSGGFAVLSGGGGDAVGAGVLSSCGGTGSCAEEQAVTANKNKTATNNKHNFFMHGPLFDLYIFYMQ
jgi:hypothetical protein